MRKERRSRRSKKAFPHSLSNKLFVRPAFPPDILSFSPVPLSPSHRHRMTLSVDSYIMAHHHHGRDGGRKGAAAFLFFRLVERRGVFGCNDDARPATSSSFPAGVAACIACHAIPAPPSLTIWSPSRFAARNSDAHFTLHPMCMCDFTYDLMCLMRKPFNHHIS